MGIHSIIQADTMLDLRNYDVSAWTAGSLQSSALLIDCTSSGDQKGGLYRWDMNSTLPDDQQYFNVISSSSTPNGRWLRVFQKTSVYPQGTVVSIGGVKTMYVTGLTDGSGQFTANLTTDNTATGPNIFTEVWVVEGKPRASVTNLANAPDSYPKTFPDANNNLKQVVMQFYKPSAPQTIVAGLVPLSVTVIDANTPVVVEIIGV